MKKKKEVELGALFWPKIPNWEQHFIPYIYKEIYFEGVYIDVMNGKKDLVIVDVGANIGCTVQYFRDYAKHVYAIEPSTEHFAALTKNKEFNNWDNVSLHNIALADKDGEMTLSINEQNHTMHSLMYSAENEQAQRAGWTSSEKVRTQSFASFMAENNIDEIDFVKFDVEGADELILYSEGFTSIAHKIKAIEIEFHHPTFPQLVDHLVRLGFTARRYPSSAVVVLFTR